MLDFWEGLVFQSRNEILLYSKIEVLASVMASPVLYLKKGQGYLVSSIHRYCPVTFGVFRVAAWVFWGSY